MSTATGIDLITRGEWNARPPRGRSFVNWPAGVDLWVHHTAGRIPPATVADEALVQRETQNFHMNVRRWSDYAYNYGAGPSGRLYEGRGFEVHGAHSPGRNHEPAVVLMGTYASVVPTDEQHRAVYELMEFLDAGELRGHRENSPTSCPGDAAMRKIVDGPPPDFTPTPRPVHFFEELPFPAGGHGPQVVGQSFGYASRAVMLGKLAAFKAAHPKTPVSTLRGILAQDRTVVPDADEKDVRRYFLLAWKPGTHGLNFRSKPFRDEDERNAKQAARERATDREMRPFRGRQRSFYPWPS